VSSNPTLRIEKPAVRCKVRTVVSPVEAAIRLDALDREDRPLWATVFFAGLRRGELIGLKWEDVDLARGWRKRSSRAFIDTPRPSLRHASPKSASAGNRAGYRRGVAAERARAVATPRTVAGRPGGRSATLTAIGSWYQNA
jgi:integrase